MASYKIVVAPKLYKDLKKLPSKIAKSVFLEIKNLAENPRPKNCKKLKGLSGNEYRLKVKKDYRVLYEVHDSKNLVYVLRALNRKESYRSL